MSTTSYTLEPGSYKFIDLKLMLESFHPHEVKVNLTIGDIRLRSNLSTNRTNRFTQNSFFFYTILGFTQSHSGPLGDNEKFTQLISGKYENKKPNKKTGIDKVHLKCNRINGGIVNGNREPILYNFWSYFTSGSQNFSRT